MRKSIYLLPLAALLAMGVGAQTPPASAPQASAVPPPVVPTAPNPNAPAPGASGSVAISVTTNQADRNLISIQVEHAPLTEVVRAFTQLVGANIILGTNGNELVTISLKDVEWEPALRGILESIGKTLVMKTPGIYVIASQAGANNEPLAVDTLQFKFLTASNSLPMVEKMLVGSNTSVAVITSANALVIKAPLNNITDIRKMIESVDQPPRQVFIEAKFVELNEDAVKDLGIDWQSLQGVTLGAKNLADTITQTRTVTQDRNATSARADQQVNALGTLNYGNAGSALAAQGPATFPTAPVNANAKVTPTAPTISGTAGQVLQSTIAQGQTVTLGIQNENSLLAQNVLTAVLSASDFSMVLSALKQNAGTTIVNNPRLLVASGQSAMIHVGTEQPYAKKSTTQQGTGGNSTQSEIDMIKTGAELTVTPTVNLNSNITLRIKPRLSTITGSVTIDGNPIPILTTRDVDTEFNIADGHTVAIGGLATTDDNQIISKIPLLGDIPILGKYLFSHTHTEKVQDEVIIFISVSVARAENIKESDGIPSSGQLIRRYQLKAKADAAESEKQLAEEARQLQDAQQKKATPRRRALFE